MNREAIIEDMFFNIKKANLEISQCVLELEGQFRELRKDSQTAQEEKQ